MSCSDARVCHFLRVKKRLHPQFIEANRMSLKHGNGDGALSSAAAPLHDLG